MSLSNRLQAKQNRLPQQGVIAGTDMQRKLTLGVYSVLIGDGKKIVFSWRGWFDHQFERQWTLKCITWYQVLSTRYLVPGTWYQVLGTKYLVPSTWNLAQILAKNRIFQILADSMSSGTQNAQNFAAIISSMVLEPSFFDRFLEFGFSRDVFPK